MRLIALSFLLFTFSCTSSPVPFSLDDIKVLIQECGIIGAIAGSLFIYKGRFRAVLINYPSIIDKQNLFQN